MGDIARQFVTIALLVVLVVGGAVCVAATSPSAVGLPASHPTAVPDPHPGAVHLMNDDKTHEQGVRPTAGWASVVTVISYVGSIRQPEGAGVAAIERVPVRTATAPANP